MVSKYNAVYAYMATFLEPPEISKVDSLGTTPSTMSMVLYFRAIIVAVNVELEKND